MGCVVYPQKAGTTHTLIYKNIALLYYHEKIEMAAFERETDRQRTAMIDTMWRNIFRALLLWQEVWYRPRRSPAHLRADVYSLTALRMTDRLIENLLHYIFSGRPHIYLLAQFMIPFHCLLFNLRHRNNILFWNPQLTCCQISICNRWLSQHCLPYKLFVFMFHSFWLKFKFYQHYRTRKSEINNII